MSGDALLAGSSSVAPAAGLFALGLGLCAGMNAQRGGESGRRAAPIATAALGAGWLAGGVWGAQRDAPDVLTWIALASVPLVGIAAALAVRLSRAVLAASAAILGGVHGAIGAVAGVPIAALGAALGAVVLAGLGTVGALLVRGPRTLVAARVAGSWIAAMGVLLVAWQARPEVAAPAASCSSCAEAKLTNAWCEACAVGWVASFEIESRSLFDALDAHGHDLDRERLECATCRELFGAGGFCDACRFGWVAGQAYMSRLTYHLALGTPTSREDVACAGCAELFGGTGWCTACDSGWAGSVRFPDRDDHAAAVREVGRLHEAIAASSRCETCALVILVDGRCPYCKVRYALGEPVGDEGG